MIKVDFFCKIETIVSRIYINQTFFCNILHAFNYIVHYELLYIESNIRSFHDIKSTQLFNNNQRFHRVHYL